ncbi:endonuclease Rec12 [Schizosaccharomyces japonicus yFS275]|uniref:DNA topoisomerase (ATP-hydrolyzing) n=1 Tax=Schizosaccharomyces japonicus (strain yFS275 / FY16936) TaxID=402676 RepID=B6K3T2_SCHJY|nr:endonuclease Rec12 [Schizosaccharomyces japonicus yFS275]EEB08139.2 endonuclease Rec12 [Schizosaccharomyces japonicus yFS275]
MPTLIKTRDVSAEDASKKHKLLQRPLRSCPLPTPKQVQNWMQARLEEFCIEFLRAVSENERMSSVNRLSFPKHAKRCAQMFRLVDLLHQAINNNTVLQLRDIYYHDVGLFERQSTVDALVRELTRTFCCSRSELHVTAAGKGLVYGPVTIHTKLDTISCMSKPWIIQYSLDIQSIRTSADTLVIVEKEATFHTLIDAFPLPNVVFVTAKGFPDLSTRQFISLFVQETGVRRAYGLFDWDPYGVSIYMCYKYGSSVTRNENMCTTKTLQPIGPFYEDFKQLDEQFMLPITTRDFRIASNLLRTIRPLQEPIVVRELQKMLFLARKAEIQGIPNVKTWLSKKISQLPFSTEIPS